MSFGRKLFEQFQAQRLLTKKLYGLVVARNCVNKKHAFYTSILHVQCENENIAHLLQLVYGEIMKERTWAENLHHMRVTEF